MKIGIIGLGVVGSAVKHGFERIGHDVRAFDIRLPETSLRDVLETEVVFICVPTPQGADGSCDISIVESIVGELDSAQYPGVVAIKSTVPPETTVRLEQKHGLWIAFCPEFLRERSAHADFVENHDVCVIGTHSDRAYDAIAKAHGSLPKAIVRMTTTEAELAKYFSNVYNALRVVFANEFFEVCKVLGADYTVIKNAMVKQRTIEDVYLDCNDRFRGFGGVCLPKDTAAFAAIVKSLGIDMKLFELIVTENKKFKTTVPDGMRG